jgi:hypothetical protein
MSALLARYRALPRAARWLVLLGLVVAVVLLVVDPILKATADLNGRADAAAAALADERALAERWSSLGPIRATFGRPLPPGPEAQRKQALYARVNQVLDRHRIRPEITERTATLRDDLANRDLLQGAERIDRLILDITFEAEPATVTAVLAELEQAPEIAAISRVQVRRADTGRGAAPGAGATRRVRAVLSPEAWVRVGGAAGGRA